MILTYQKSVTSVQKKYPLCGYFGLGKFFYSRLLENKIIFSQHVINLFGHQLMRMRSWVIKVKE